MSQRNDDRNRNRSSNFTRRESSSHPYWHSITCYFVEELRASTPTSSTPQAPSTSQASSSPFLPLLPSFPSSQSLSFPIQPPLQNPYYYPNPINLVFDNSIFPLNFTTESINNLANIFRNVDLGYQNINLSSNVESRSTNSSNRRSRQTTSLTPSSSRSHVTSMDHPPHSASTSTSSPLNFNLNSFPYTLSSLERYEIQIRIEGKITPINIISPHQLNKLLKNCKKDHKTRTNSQGNIYCKKRKNVYHYHNLSNASFYSKRADGSSIYADQFGDITYKA